MKQRLDQLLVTRHLVASRSQAESYIKLGSVLVDNKKQRKPGYMVDTGATVSITIATRYVSRAALKLASVCEALDVVFNDRVVLDIGSSTGGFTDYALDHGASRVIAIEVGTDQMDGRLRQDPRVELYEKTDIRSVYVGKPPVSQPSAIGLSSYPDIIVADVSFISLRELLPTIWRLSSKDTDILLMVKPQFEATFDGLSHKGIIKNDTLRRSILKSFELAAKDHFRIIAKADSAVKGAKGNLERFYLLHKLNTLKP